MAVWFSFGGIAVVVVNCVAAAVDVAVMANCVSSVADVMMVAGCASSVADVVVVDVVEEQRCGCGGQFTLCRTFSNTETIGQPIRL